MYFKTYLIILASLALNMAYAQYTCKAISICEEGGHSDSTILFVKEYNAKNQLIKEVSTTSAENQQSTVATYTYTFDGLLKTVVDSNQFCKVVKEYSYRNGKITNVLEVIFTLSTENFNYKEPFFPDDSIRGNIQPAIRYVWLIDTLTQVYHYNAKGLLIKISKKRKDELYERTETFGYDEQNRLVRSQDSDRFLYKYYYDTTSRVIKKEKFTNSYIDDSGIGPDLKPESVRIKKAVWDLSTTYKMSYDTAGRINQHIEFTRSQAAATLTETYFYDQKGRLIQTTSRQEFADAYFPLCRIEYTYE